MAGIKNRDERQIRFLSYYLDPKSSTSSNALQSAIRAGFSRKYANQIVSIGLEWVNEAIRKREKMLVKAERNLDAMLDLETKEGVRTMMGTEVLDKDGNLVKRENPQLLKTKADVSKFVAERIGKTVYGAPEKGEPPIVNFNFFGDEQLKRIARRVTENVEDTREDNV